MEKSKITEVILVSVARAAAGRAVRPTLLWGEGASAVLSDAKRVDGVTLLSLSGAEGLAAGLRRACRVEDTDASLGAGLVSAGRRAQTAGTPLMVLATDLADADPSDLGDFVQALHEVSQSGVPLIFVGDGGPDAHRRLGEARDYAETMFTFARVDADPEETPRP